MRGKLEQVEAALQQASDMLEHAASGEGLEPGSRHEEEHEAYVAVNGALALMRDLKHQQNEIGRVAAVLDDDTVGYDALLEVTSELCDGYRDHLVCVGCLEQIPLGQVACDKDGTTLTPIYCPLCIAKQNQETA